MDYALSLVTAASERAVTVSLAKQHLRVDHADEDELIGNLVDLAIDTIEQSCNTSLVTQTWDMILPRFPCGSFYLPRSPVASITSITYYDIANVLQTLTLATYVDQLLSAKPAELHLKYGYSWPCTYSRPNAVTVRYVAGFGTEAAVPPALKAAALMLVGDLYENRSSVITGTISAEIAAVAARNVRAKYEIPDLSHCM
jgi:uncharacterized phiE125 gp8 family phage protein